MKKSYILNQRILEYSGSSYYSKTPFLSFFLNTSEPFIFNKILAQSILFPFYYFECPVLQCSIVTQSLNPSMIINVVDNKNPLTRLHFPLCTKFGRNMFFCFYYIQPIHNYYNHRKDKQIYIRVNVKMM